MCIRNRVVSLIYKILIFIACAVGLVFSAGLLQGQFTLQFFNDYAALITLVCLVFYLCAIIAGIVDISKKGAIGATTFGHHLKGALIVSLLALLGLFVYQNFFSQQAAASMDIGQMIMYFAMPALVLLDYVLFDRKGRYHFSDPIVWLLLPYFFYAYVLGRAQLGIVYPDGSLYPYAFLNPLTDGWTRALMNVGLLTLLFLIVGYVLFIIDLILGNIAKKNAPAEAALPDDYNPDIEDLDAVEKLDDAAWADVDLGAVAFGAGVGGMLASEDDSLAEDDSAEFSDVFNTNEDVAAAPSAPPSSLFDTDKPEQADPFVQNDAQEPEIFAGLNDSAPADNLRPDLTAERDMHLQEELPPQDEQQPPNLFAPSHPVASLESNILTGNANFSNRPAPLSHPGNMAYVPNEEDRAFSQNAGPSLASTASFAAQRNFSSQNPDLGQDAAPLYQPATVAPLPQENASYRMHNTASFAAQTDAAPMHGTGAFPAVDTHAGAPAYSHLTHEAPMHQTGSFSAVNSHPQSSFSSNANVEEPLAPTSTSAPNNHPLAPQMAEPEIKHEEHSNASADIYTAPQHPSVFPPAPAEQNTYSPSAPVTNWNTAPVTAETEHTQIQAAPYTPAATPVVDTVNDYQAPASFSFSPYQTDAAPIEYSSILKPVSAPEIAPPPVVHSTQSFYVPATYATGDTAPRPNEAYIPPVGTKQEAPVEVKPTSYAPPQYTPPAPPQAQASYLSFPEPERKTYPPVQETPPAAPTVPPEPPKAPAYSYPPSSYTPPVVTEDSYYSNFQAPVIESSTYYTGSFTPPVVPTAPPAPQQEPENLRTPVIHDTPSFKPLSESVAPSSAGYGHAAPAGYEAPYVPENTAHNMGMGGQAAPGAFRRPVYNTQSIPVNNPGNANVQNVQQAPLQNNDYYSYDQSEYTSHPDVPAQQVQVPTGHAPVNQQAYPQPTAHTGSYSVQEMRQAYTQPTVRPVYDAPQNTYNTASYNTSLLGNQYQRPQSATANPPRQQFRTQQNIWPNPNDGAVRPQTSSFPAIDPENHRGE